MVRTLSLCLGGQEAEQEVSGGEGRREEQEEEGMMLLHLTRCLCMEPPATTCLATLEARGMILWQLWGTASLESRERIIPSMPRSRKLDSPARDKWMEVTTRTLRLSAGPSISALLMELEGWPSTASSVPTEHCSTRTTSSVTGGSTSTAPLPRISTPSTMRSPRSGNRSPELRIPASECMALPEVPAMALPLRSTPAEV